LLVISEKPDAGGAPLRITVVQWPDGLFADESAWQSIAIALADIRPDILVTNELPFGPWIAARPDWDEAIAAASITEHAAGIAALQALRVPAILSSRPVAEDGRLANEAVVLDASGVRGIHRKQYLPQEPGWYEASWYGTAARSFDPVDVLGAKVGVLLCTEAMFNEHARAYGRNGADLIVIPRATGCSMEEWHLAGRMAALVSGSYVASSNRVGRHTDRGLRFGGEGFAYAPDGRLLGVTAPATPFLTFELEPHQVIEAKAAYPRYVPER
jgi:N-carbamoylputrescine amidase